jgi:hypothetical protein
MRLEIFVYMITNGQRGVVFAASSCPRSPDRAKDPLASRTRPDQASAFKSLNILSIQSLLPLEFVFKPKLSSQALPSFFYSLLVFSNLCLNSASLHSSSPSLALHNLITGLRLLFRAHWSSTRPPKLKPPGIFDSQLHTFHGIFDFLNLTTNLLASLWFLPPALEKQFLSSSHTSSDLTDFAVVAPLQFKRRLDDFVAKEPLHSRHVSIWMAHGRSATDAHPE